MKRKKNCFQAQSIIICRNHRCPVQPPPVELETWNFANIFLQLGGDLYILESKHTPVSYTKAYTLEQADDCLKIAMFHSGEAIISHSSPPVWNIFIFFILFVPPRIIIFKKKLANAAIQVLFPKVALVSRKRRCTIGKINESRRFHRNKQWSVNCRMTMPSPIHSIYLRKRTSAEAETRRTRRYGDDVSARERERNTQSLYVAISRLDKAAAALGPKRGAQSCDNVLRSSAKRCVLANYTPPIYIHNSEACVEKKLDGSREPVHSSHFDIAREHYIDISHVIFLAFHFYTYAFDNFSSTKIKRNLKITFLMKHDFFSIGASSFSNQRFR
uniref:Uncharacterized protein n=1 Tax=Trichogramma kaykai TaxID=54128 RepID=A0ABD2VUU0_9HYME